MPPGASGNRTPLQAGIEPVPHPSGAPRALVVFCRLSELPAGGGTLTRIFRRASVALSLSYPGIYRTGPAGIFTGRSGAFLVLAHRQAVPCPGLLTKGGVVHGPRPRWLLNRRGHIYQKLSCSCSTGFSSARRAWYSPQGKHSRISIPG